MVDLLQRCRDLVERGWCRHADARDANGRPVNPSSPDARAWSVAGALAAVVLDSDGMHFRRAPIGAVEDVVTRFARVTGATSLRKWNDAAVRTQGKVLAAFERPRLAVAE